MEGAGIEPPAENPGFPGEPGFEFGDVSRRELVERDFFPHGGLVGGGLDEPAARVIGGVQFTGRN